MATEKRIILITGASNGIGLDTTYALAAASPNNHIIMGVRNPSKGQEKLKELESKGIQGTISILQLDVTSDSDVSSAVSAIEKDFGRLDVLVNNAGIVVLGGLTRDNLRKVFETNVFGAVLLTQAIAPLLQKSKDPRVINVSSGLGSIGKMADPDDEYHNHRGNESYRISKAALNMSTCAEAAMFEQWGCKVWSYCPGFVDTDLVGPEMREMRRARGAESSETSATGIREIVEGKRDGETNKFVARFGKQYPW